MPKTGDRQTLMFSATFPKEIQVSIFYSSWIIKGRCCLTLRSWFCND
jgi:hypothetical protein